MSRSLSAQGAISCLFAGLLLAPVAMADEGARISRLETEIQQLRSQLDEQNRRIQQLEAELARRAGAPALPQPRPRSGDRPTGTPAASGPQPWHTAPAWARVKPGMTEAQVIAILGAPSAAEAVGALKSLFYRGVPGRVELGGHVNLKDGQVVAVSQPAF